MGITDVILMGLILAGALYLLYRSIWKKGGCCSGCGAACGVKRLGVSSDRPAVDGRKLSNGKRCSGN